MDELFEVLKARRSIRKYLPTEISNKDIQDIVCAGINAPSGCNSQCWRFIAVKDKNLLCKIAQETENGVTRFYNKGDFSKEFVQRRIKHVTFFKNAPLVIFVFLDKLDYYDTETVRYYKQLGYSYREMMDYFGYPDVLSIGAAIENMLLMIHHKGLGACWMNDPIIAQDEIHQALGVTKEYRLLSVIPVGYPAYIPRTKQMKKMEEVLTILE